MTGRVAEGSIPNLSSVPDSPHMFTTLVYLQLTREVGTGLWAGVSEYLE